MNHERADLTRAAGRFAGVWALFFAPKTRKGVNGESEMRKKKAEAK